MDADYAALYPSLYRHHWWWRAREAILLQKVRELTAPTPGARILDVGCGAGLFFDELEPFGHVEGIESDADAVARSGRWRDRITVGQLDETYRPDRSFDIVLLLDLLEHVHDPAAVLGRARSILAPSGLVLMTVPAFTSLWTSHDDINHHLRRYTARQLTRDIEQAGLAPRDVQYLFQSLVLPKALVKVKELVVGRQRQLPKIRSTSFNRAVAWWYGVEHRIAGALPFGGSILAVAGRGRHETTRGNVKTVQSR